MMFSIGNIFLHLVLISVRFILSSLTLTVICIRTQRLRGMAFVCRGLSRESVRYYVTSYSLRAHASSTPSYFLLWLKEYAIRYDQWVAQTRPAKSDSNPKEQYRFSNQVQHSTALTLFYLRAKQTFFTPGAEYELNIPSDVLSPFHTGHFVSPHPDPIVFSEVAWQVHSMLKDSLERFVYASYYNVGTNRALCGMLGGIVIALAGSLPPIAVNFATDRSRWLRLLALPGLWLGLTILVASMHGVRLFLPSCVYPALILQHRFA